MLDFGTTEVNIVGVVLDDGVNLTFATNYPWSATYDSVAGTIVNTRVASTYVWTPGESSTDWATLSNWRIGGTVPVALPGVNDSASFTSTCEVVLSANYGISNLIVAADAELTLSGGGAYGLTGLHELPAGGLLKLNGSGLASVAIPKTAELPDWGLNIEVVSGTSNWITPNAVESDNGGGRWIPYAGNLTGEGAILLGNSNDTKRASVVLKGDNRQFAGIATLQPGASKRARITFQSATASSENARWIVTGSDRSAAAGCGAIGVANAVMKFGTYEGSCYIAACGGGMSGTTVEIGALNLNCTNALSACSNPGSDTYRNSSATLRKVGTGEMVFGSISTPCWSTYEMNGGVLRFANNDILITYAKDGSYKYSTFKFTGGTMAYDASCTNTVDESLLDISAYVKASTSAISISLDAGQSATWSAQLDSSNTGGLIKKGEGTLTLAAAPQYTGDTYLDGGKLRILKSSNNKTVKTHVPEKSVRKQFVTIDGVDYIEYRLDRKIGSALIYF